MLQFSLRTFDAKLSEARNGLVDSDEHTRHGKDTIHGLFSGWMSMKFDCECEQLPNSTQRILTCCNTKQEVYEECVEELRNAGLLKADRGSLSYFLEIWQRDYKNVVIPKQNNRFAKCTECEGFKDEIKKTKDPGQKAKIRGRKKNHLDIVFAERKAYWAIRQFCRYDPDMTSIIIDAMDKSKTSPPRWPQRTHAQDKYDPHTLKLTGAIIHGAPNEYYFFLSDDTIPADTNLNAAIIMRILTELSNKPGGLKKKLHFQFDNTSAGNKNIRMYAFLGMLVQFQVVEEIYVEYLNVGHTHEDIDAVFSKVSIFLQKCAIEVVSIALWMLGQFMKRFRTRPPYKELLKHVPDTWHWLKGCYNPIKGISQSRSIRIAMKGQWAHIWSKATMAESAENYAPCDGVQLIWAIPHSQPHNVILKPLRLENLSAMVIHETRLFTEDERFTKEWKLLRVNEKARQKRQCTECMRLRIMDRDSGKRQRYSKEENKMREAQRRKAKRDMDLHMGSGTCKSVESPDDDWFVKDWFFDKYTAIVDDDIDAKHVDNKSPTPQQVTIFMYY